VIFMVSRNGVFPESRLHPPEHVRKTLEFIDLAIHEIACRDENIGIGLPDFLEDPGQAPWRMMRPRWTSKSGRR